MIQITMEAIRSQDDEVCLQGIEFWSNICEEEMDLSIELSEVSFNLKKSLIVYMVFCLV